MKAEDFNRMLAALHLLLNIRGGDGVEVRLSGAGLVIGLAGGGAEEWIPSRISNVYVDENQSAASSDVVYDIKPIGRPDIGTVTGMIPKYGRPVKDSDGVEIWPAKVGDPCWLIRRPSSTPPASGTGSGMKAELMVVTEKVAWTGCPPPAARAPAAPVLPGIFDLTPMLPDGA